jgi:catechol 2,3-dioxygenase-like lactoylglutathione lyase family enzyme
VIRDTQSGYHITIAVADAGPAIAFFALLGFRKGHVATIDGADPHFEIQLLEFDPPSGTDPGAHPTNLRKLGFNHLAFRVDDIEATTAQLVANGVTVLSDEMDYISRKLRLSRVPRASPSSWYSRTAQTLLAKVSSPEPVVLE